MNKNIVVYGLGGFFCLYVFIIIFMKNNYSKILYQPQKRSFDEIISFAKLKKYQVLNYKTHDDIKLSALFKDSINNKPIIMIFNGNAATVERAHSCLDKFIKKGYGVFINIYRGYGGNQGVPNQDNIFKDAQLAYDMLVKNNPKKEVVFYGYSLGSGVATYMASKNKNKALIIESGFSSIFDIAKDSFWFLPVSLILKDKYMSRNYIKDVKSNILMMHGLDDKVINIKYAKKLSKYIRNETFISYISGTHLNLKSLNADEDALSWLENLSKSSRLIIN
ncbi:MAG: alpha/beta hydrolase [Proteobacteria bacterium]|nr:alpha/beta hydrolase [Pseudomonadota bacterium]